MKNATLYRAVLGAAVVLSGLLTVPAMAQTELRVQIPFEFRAGDTLMPAGQYIAVVDTSVSGFKLYQVDGHAAVAVPAHTATRKITRDCGGLVFHQYGKIYVLRQVFRGGDSWGLQTSPTRLERELVAQLNPLTAVVDAGAK